MDSKIVIIGTLDTKGEEFKFLKDCIEGLGQKTLVVNTGILGEPFFEPDISADEVASLGGKELSYLRENNDRGRNVHIMRQGASEIVARLYSEGKLAGVVSLGGTAGTTIGTYAMQNLPVGVPKLQVSTVASGDTRPYVGTKDITMMYSVVDIAGLNSISKKIISNAAGAIVGMVLSKNIPVTKEKPLLAATMFGVTTPCVNKAREYLESKGYEVLVFHATGTGGQSMEGLIEGGFIKGVLDVTTTEWADELVGGVFAAGQSRLEAAGAAGIPQVVSVGALDMVNFGAFDTVPEKFKNRNLYKHNDTITLMRTTVAENKRLGEILSEKLNKAKGPVALFLPLKGVSMIDSPGKPFYGPKENLSLFSSIRKNTDKKVIQLIEKDCEINDEEFALAMAKKLVEMLEGV